ncbi:hypothetical protein Tcan_00099, partial [Toxocara canis]
MLVVNSGRIHFMLKRIGGKTSGGRRHLFFRSCARSRYSLSACAQLFDPSHTFTGYFFGIWTSMCDVNAFTWACAYAAGTVGFPIGSVYRIRSQRYNGQFFASGEKLSEFLMHNSSSMHKRPERELERMKATKWNEYLLWKLTASFVRRITKKPNNYVALDYFCFPLMVARHRIK